MSKIVNQRAEALAYLKKHDLLKLFDHLGAKLAKGKPDNPNAFLLAELDQLVEARNNKEVVTLFTEQDIEIMFSMFDLTNKGYVTKEQYLKALGSGCAGAKAFPHNDNSDTLVTRTLKVTVRNFVFLNRNKYTI
jgi:hypothetical protein